MPLSNPAELGQNLPRGGRLLGFDVGEKTIGLAISDVMLSLAHPLMTLKRGRFADAVAALTPIMTEQRIGGLVVGLPLNMDGSEGPRVQASRAFATNLLKHFDLPLVFWDERLSTVAVERAMIERDVSRAKRAERIDAAAAAFILQGVLDLIRLHLARGR